MEKNNRDGRYRRWMITWNNWQEHFRSNASCESIVKKINETSGLLHQYIVVSKETAPETQKVHLHIYVEYVNQATFKQMKERYLGSHIEIARSPAYQCAMYVKKDKDFYEEGEYRQTKLNADDIANNVISLIEEYEMRPSDIAIKYPEYAAYIVRNYKNLNDIYLDIKQNKIMEDKEVPF